MDQAIPGHHSDLDLASLEAGLKLWAFFLMALMLFLSNCCGVGVCIVFLVDAA